MVKLTGPQRAALGSVAKYGTPAMVGALNYSWPPMAWHGPQTEAHGSCYPTGTPR